MKRRRTRPNLGRVPPESGFIVVILVCIVLLIWAVAEWYKLRNT